MRTLPLPLYFPKPRALPRPLALHVFEHGAKPMVMSEQKLRQICQIAKERTERVMRRDYGRQRRLRLEAADGVGRSERTLTRWIRGESDPTLWDVMSLIAATGNVDLLRAFLEPFGFSVAKTEDVEAVEKLRTADQLRPFLTGSLSGLKDFFQAWEDLRCPRTVQKESTSSGAPES